MQRRNFLSGIAGVGGAGVLGTLGIDAVDATAATIDPILFDSTSSLLNTSDGPLTDDSVVAVRAASSASNVDEDGNGDAVSYPDGTPIAVAAIDGSVFGVGTPLVPNDVDFGYGQEEFLLNVYDELLGGSGTVLWDASHGQFYQLDSDANGGSGPGFEQFETYAEGNGYTLEATTDLTADLSGADGVVITSPSDAFTTSELDALSSFVSNGGVVFLHDQSDFDDFDETANINEIAAALGVGFRFNDDQVLDSTSNAGSDFLPTSTNFNDATFPTLFENRPGIDEANALDPSKTYTVDVTGVADGDTVDVQFDDDRVESIRVLGVDTPETRSASDAERPEEWEGLADRVGLETLQFGSTSSLLDDSMAPLTDDSVAVLAEPSATNTDTDGNGDAVDYPADTDIPLVALEGSVAGLGSIFVNDGAVDNNAALDNEEFALNLWDELLGGSGTVRWDESHGQFYDLSKASSFAAYAEENGYTVESGTTIPSDTSSVDGLVVTTPSDGFSSSELGALSSFVADGGAVVLHDQSDFDNFDATTNLNAVAAELGVGFRFNDDQVTDPENNTGQSFRPTTGRFDPSFDLFRERQGIDQELVVSSEGTAVEELVFQEGTASLLNDASGPLTDDSLVPVRAESSATNTDSDGNGDAVSYPSDVDIPLVAVDGAVAAIGAPFVNDDAAVDPDNEEFVLNLWDELLGGSGTVRWDESHGQFYDLAKFSRLEAYAEDNGYTVESGTTIPSDTSSVDGLVVTSPSDGFSSSELGALSSFVADGGAVVLHDQSDFDDFDATANLNAVAAELGVGFRFNDDQVLDSQNNLDAEFRPTTTNFNTSGFSALFTKRTGVDDVTSFWGATYPYLSYNARLASTFATEQLEGRRVDISFDPVGAQFNDGVKDPFGRVLAYIEYDADGSGSRDTLYNERLISEGYARSYASSLSKLEQLVGAEQSARDAGIGVWRQSNPNRSPEIRNGSVDSVYVPKAVRVDNASQSLGADRVAVSAGSSASPADAPLIALDEDSGVGVVGGLLVDESYEQREGFPVDTSTYGNFTLLGNVIDTLGDGEGPVLVAGGKGQFNASYALSAEDVAYFQRFLEGVDVGLEAVNDLTAARVSDARAVLVTPPTAALSNAELDALSAFADAGGAVVLLGAANAPADARSNLNAVASAVGSDLRVTDDAVTDGSSNLDGDATLPVTTAFDDGFDLFDPFRPGVTIPTVSVEVEEGRVGADGSTTATVRLDEAPNGVAGFRIDVGVTDTGVAEVSGGSYPDAFGLTEDPDVATDGSAVTLKASDTEDAIQPGATDVVLATVDLSSVDTGTTDLTATIQALDADGGDAIDPMIETGVVDIAPVERIGDNPLPTDPDGDGKYEDLNGDGQVDINDVMLLFRNKSSDVITGYTDSYDYNDNGRIDFDDVNVLYEEA